MFSSPLDAHSGIGVPDAYHMQNSHDPVAGIGGSSNAAAVLVSSVPPLQQQQQQQQQPIYFTTTPPPVTGAMPPAQQWFHPPQPDGRQHPSNTSNSNHNDGATQYYGSREQPMYLAGPLPLIHPPLQQQPQQPQQQQLFFIGDQNTSNSGVTASASNTLSSPNNPNNHSSGRTKGPNSRGHSSPSAAAATPEVPTPALTAARQSTTNIFVRHVPPEMDDDKLRELFSLFGSITSHAIMRNIHTGESLGTAFVRFKAYEEAKAAMDTVNAFVKAWHESCLRMGSGGTAVSAKSEGHTHGNGSSPSANHALQQHQQHPPQMTAREAANHLAAMSFPGGDGSATPFTRVRDFFESLARETAAVPRFPTKGSKEDNQSRPHSEPRERKPIPAAVVQQQQQYCLNMSVQWAKKKHDAAPAGTEKHKIHKLFVRNIPSVEATVDRLTALFAPFGTVRSVTVHRDTRAATRFTPRSTLHHDATATNLGDADNGTPDNNNNPGRGEWGKPGACDDTSSGGGGVCEERKIAFITYEYDGAAEKAAAAIHNTEPFAACEGVPLMVKLADDTSFRHYRVSEAVHPVVDDRSGSPHGDDHHHHHRGGGQVYGGAGLQSSPMAPPGFFGTTAAAAPPDLTYHIYSNSSGGVALPGMSVMTTHSTLSSNTMHSLSPGATAVTPTVYHFPTSIPVSQQNSLPGCATAVGMSAAHSSSAFGVANPLPSLASPPQQTAHPFTVVPAVVSSTDANMGEHSFAKGNNNNSNTPATTASSGHNPNMTGGSMPSTCTSSYSSPEFPPISQPVPVHRSGSIGVLNVNSLTTSNLNQHHHHHHRNNSSASSIGPFHHTRNASVSSSLQGVHPQQQPPPPQQMPPPPQTLLPSVGSGGPAAYDNNKDPTTTTTTGGSGSGGLSCPIPGVNAANYFHLAPAPHHHPHYNMVAGSNLSNPSLAHSGTGSSSSNNNSSTAAWNIGGDNANRNTSIPSSTAPPTVAVLPNNNVMHYAGPALGWVPAVVCNNVASHTSAFPSSALSGSPTTTTSLGGGGAPATGQHSSSNNNGNNPQTFSQIVELFQQQLEQQNMINSLNATATSVSAGLDHTTILPPPPQQQERQAEGGNGSGGCANEGSAVVEGKRDEGGNLWKAQPPHQQPRRGEFGRRDEEGCLAGTSSSLNTSPQSSVRYFSSLGGLTTSVATLADTNNNNNNTATAVQYANNYGDYSHNHVSSSTQTSTATTAVLQDLVASFGMQLAGQHGSNPLLAGGDCVVGDDASRNNSRLGDVGGLSSAPQGSPLPPHPAVALQSGTSKDASPQGTTAGQLKDRYASAAEEDVDDPDDLADEHVYRLLDVFRGQTP